MCKYCIYILVLNMHPSRISPQDSHLFSTHFSFWFSIFLVDHAWTFQPANARQQLLHIPGLANRMAAVVGLTSIPVEMLMGGRGRGSDEEVEGAYEADSESGMIIRLW